MKILDQKTFSEKYEADIKKFAEHHSKVYGHLPLGFEGTTFLFNFGTIVIDDNLESLLQNDSSFNKEIDQIFTRFKNDDWGEVSFDIQKRHNVKFKYFGGADSMIAVYGTPKGFVRVDTMRLKLQSGEHEFCTFLSFEKQKNQVYAPIDQDNFLIANQNREKVKKFVEKQAEKTK